MLVVYAFSADEAKDLGAHASRRVEDLNFEWRFKRLDVVNDVEASLAGYDFGPQGPEAVDYDDSDWESIDLPHDWAIDAGYAEDNLNRDRYVFAIIHIIQSGVPVENIMAMWETLQEYWIYS
jgi:hypothetical protein